MAEDLIKKSEQLREKKSLSEVLETLNEANLAYPNHVEILWRLARAHFEWAELKPEDKGWREDPIKKGYAHSLKALELDHRNGFAHKWAALMTSSMNDFLGPQQKIRNASFIKDHALKANELSPKDPVTLLLLGKWHLMIASLSWFERKAMSAVLDSPPQASLEEAIRFLNEGYEADPKFRKILIALGDTYVSLKKKDDAKRFYQKAIDLPPTSPFEETLVSQVKQKLHPL